MLFRSGLDRYAGAFDQQKIDPDILETLSDADLKDLGVDTLGAGRKILQVVPGGAPAAGSITASSCRSTTAVSLATAGQSGLESRAPCS